LDGVERTIQAGMTLICDAKGPTGIGGVMGGADSEVDAKTTNVVLECAYFNPQTIRATRMRLGMSTDASYRFERGADIHSMELAFRRAVAMILATAGGSEDDKPVDVYPKPVAVRSVFLRIERIRHLLGVDIPREDIERYLTALGFTVAPKDDRFAVQVPGWRPDVTREVDLIEELARLQGYDSFPTILQPFRPSAVPNEPEEGVKDRCRSILTGNGLHEARSMTMGPETGAHAQPVLNPLSAEEGFLRADLMSGLARSVAHNWSARVRDVRLFEIGIVFETRGPGELPKERLRVGGVVTGALQPPHWSDAAPLVDFDIWDVKSLLSEVSDACGPVGAIEAAGDRLVYRDQSGVERGWAGRIEVDGPPWAAPVFGFEVELTRQPKAYASFAETANQPPVERDLALVLPAGVSAADVEAVILRRGGGYLESVAVFDEYRGSDITGRSVAWRLVFRAREKTLRDKEVDAAVEKILEALRGQLRVDRR
jgi:phenylalanyl-tRNA synthetase beta chain